MENRKFKYLVIDTETANGLDCPLVYDFGGAVVDNTGRVYETFSLVNRDIFIRESELMRSSYYADKLPKYYAELQDGTRILVSTFEMRKLMHELCKKWDIKAIIAHNAKFDYRSLQGTQRYVTKSKYRWFFPFKIPIWDTQVMAKDTICQTTAYKNFCVENGFMTKHKTPRPRQTAEVLYAYITKNPDYKEDHTGLADVLIEKEIFVSCLKMKKKMRRNAFRG